MLMYALPSLENCLYFDKIQAFENYFLKVSNLSPPTSELGSAHFSTTLTALSITLKTQTKEDIILKLGSHVKQQK